MAKVARAQQLEPDIDYHLNYQFDVWNSVPVYEKQWPTMDSTDREVFHLEWIGITESRLRQLEQWSREGHLSARQLARYHKLLQLVERTRSTLEHLLST